MTLTLQLSPAEEARLQEMAAQSGKTTSEQLRELVSPLLTPSPSQDEAEETLDPDAVAGIREGLAQLDAGQGRPFAEFVAESRRAARV